MERINLKPKIVKEQYKELNFYYQRTNYWSKEHPERQELFSFIGTAVRERLNGIE